MERTIHSRKLLKVSLIVLVSTGFVLALMAAIHLALPVVHARRILAKAEPLQIGKSTFVEAQRVADLIDAEPIGACSAAECEWRSLTSNIAAPMWWRGSGEIFGVYIHVKDGLVERKELVYWIGFGSIVEEVYVTEDADWQGNSNTPRMTKSKDLDEVHVSLALSDSTEIRKKYTSFNWNCFWKYQGCKDAHELMPTGDW